MQNTSLRGAQQPCQQFGFANIECLQYSMLLSTHNSKVISRKTTLLSLSTNPSPMKSFWDATFETPIFATNLWMLCSRWQTASHALNREERTI